MDALCTIPIHLPGSNLSSPPPLKKQHTPLTWLARLQQRTAQNKQCFGAVMAATCKLPVPSRGDHSSVIGCCRARQGQSCCTAAQECIARVAPAPPPARCLQGKAQEIHEQPYTSWLKTMEGKNNVKTTDHRTTKTMPVQYQCR